MAWLPHPGQGVHRLVGPDLSFSNGSSKASCPSSPCARNTSPPLSPGDCLFPRVSWLDPRPFILGVTNSHQWLVDGPFKDVWGGFYSV